jgi:hypothetical protein
MGSRQRGHEAPHDQAVLTDNSTLNSFRLVQPGGRFRRLSNLTESPFAPPGQHSDERQAGPSDDEGERKAIHLPHRGREQECKPRRPLQKDGLSAPSCKPRRQEREGSPKSCRRLPLPLISREAIVSPCARNHTNASAGELPYIVLPVCLLGHRVRLPGSRAFCAASWKMECL